MFPTPAIRRWSRSHDRAGLRDRPSASTRCSGSHVSERGSGPMAAERAPRAASSRCSTEPKRRTSSKISTPPSENRNRTAGCVGRARPRGGTANGRSRPVIPRLIQMTEPSSSSRMTFFARRVIADRLRPRTLGVKRRFGSLRISGLMTSARLIVLPVTVARRPRTIVSASGSSGIDQEGGIAHSSLGSVCGSSRARSRQPMSLR